MFIKPETVIDRLRQELLLKEICHRIICQQIINQVAQSKNITVTPEEIRQEASHQRRQKRLESAADTYAWLSDQLISPEDWETGIRDRLITCKLAEYLFNDEAERYFAQCRLDFEQVLLYKILVATEALAQELFYQIAEGEASFFEIAHRYDIDEQRRLQCGYQGKVFRWALKPEMAASVFSAEPGEVIGPFKTEQGYELLMVEERISPKLTPEVQEDIQNRMFKEWLEKEINYIRHLID